MASVKSPKSPSSVADSHALHTFASATSLQDRLDALRLLQQPGQKLSSQVTSGELFLHGIAALEETLAQSEDETSRLAALTALLRIRSLSKAIEGRVDAASARALWEVSSPDLDALEPEDRVRLAEAMGRLSGSWIPSYLARRATLEMASVSKVRQSLLVALVGRTGTLTKALTELVSALDGPTLRGWGSQEAVARQLGHLMRDMRAAVQENTIPVGDGGADALARVVVILRDHGSTTEPSESWMRTADNLLELVALVARSSLTLAVSATSYVPLRYLKTSAGRGWKDYCRSSEAMKMVRTLLSEALFVRAQCGIPDAELREQLDITAGSEEAGQELASQLAQKPGLPPESRAWLLGDVSAVSQSKKHSLQLDTNLDLIAIALRDASLLADVVPSVRLAISDELSGVVPRLERLFSRQDVRVTAILNAVNTLASSRSLQAFGIPGERSSYQPGYQELIGDIPSQGLREVVLIAPGVEQRSPSGSTRVVLKALVQPA